MRAEAAALLAANGAPTDRHGKELGFHNGWLSIDFLRDGRWQEDNCARCPRTVELLRALPLCDCSLARAYFSILTAGKSISPHHGRSSRRRDCHFSDALSLSLLKHLLKVEGDAAE